MVKKNLNLNLNKVSNLCLDAKGDRGKTTLSDFQNPKRPLQICEQTSFSYRFHMVRVKNFEKFNNVEK